ncbi:MAG: peptidylprolyl isomerase [Oscillatoriales cyanobacterium]|nr:MAG: peptidylprolyl isomerase [Oscillatoriales cyanobacterium]
MAWLKRVWHDRSPQLRSVLRSVCSWAIALGLVWGGWSLSTAPAWAALPAGNAITDGRALLRYSLPINNVPIRKIQAEVESIASALRAKRWGPIASSLKSADRLVNTKRDAILASVQADRQADAAAQLDAISAGILKATTAVETKDKSAVWISRREILDAVGVIESAMVEGFPFEVPAAYSNLPQLKGRATIDIETSKGNVTVVVDGYSAPVTAGNFVDLVQRGFYDGLPFTRAEDSYVLQFGDPDGPEEGFIDPKTKQYRAIPLEILAQGDKEPTYGITLEDAGRYGDLPVLPFSSYGALAMARPEPDPDGGSSQVFFFLFEPELTPAGANLLDGRYAVFGYTISNGKAVLDKIRPGDKIIKAKVIDGLENLIQPS